MDIKLSPKKERTPNATIHNSSNTSAVEAKRILNTTAEQANAEYYFDYLIENFDSIRSAWEQKMKEAHENKVLIPIKENADELRRIVDFLKSKGGKVDVKPDLSFETLSVSVTSIFTEDLSLSFKEKEMLTDVIDVATDFYMEALPKDIGIRMYFVYNDVGRYVDAGEVNK